MTSDKPAGDVQLIPNQNGTTLEQALNQLLGQDGAGGVAPDSLRIATAFFSLWGFNLIASRVANIPQVRLLLGADLALVPFSTKQELEEPARTFDRRRLRIGLKNAEDAIQTERDRLPFTLEGNRATRRLVRALESGNIEVRRYEKNFLHAKAYIASSSGDAAPATVVGSSNLTVGGLRNNLELNLGVGDTATATQAQQWFDELWEEAEPYDLKVIYDDITPPLRPWDVYIRILWQLYGKELDEEQADDDKMGLTTFQTHGVARVRRLLKENGGALVADEVGLGKTFIAGALLKDCLDRRQRPLLICPAALRDTTWKRFLDDQQLAVPCLSYEELANERQIKRKMGLTGGKDKIIRELDEIQLVVVDEAHNYRNTTADTRYKVLRTLLFGQKRDLLLLTATPVNNSLWDLYVLISYFLKQDAHLASRGVLSIRELFNEAAREDPSDLHPDVLYPIIDATTVKRTREFVRKHYQNDKIRNPQGQLVSIQFSKPEALSVKYKLDDVLPGFFDLLQAALNPGYLADDEVPVGSIQFVRYTPLKYLLDPSEEDENQWWLRRGVAGLLRSALLKRFESSVAAFRQTLSMMIWHHELFLTGLDKGYVVSTDYLHERSGDEDEFLSGLGVNSHSDPASRYKVDELRADVWADLEILKGLAEASKQVSDRNDMKLWALLGELKQIAHQAKEEGFDEESETQKRKVLVFTHFEDSVEWIRDFLQGQFEAGELPEYSGRTAYISGSGNLDEDGEDDKDQIVHGFAPVSMGAPAGADADRYDLLITTDILSEGVNLQQCRHIINYDLPWNPMRLVQRQGRIDRIGSQHERIYMRTIFPEDRLEDLLRLEERIRQKIALAAQSVGVKRPIEDAHEGTQVFAEERHEIEKLLREDPELYLRGGTASAAQTGEEYRQALRGALTSSEQYRRFIEEMRWNVGSGMVRGTERGVVFCAVVGWQTKHERSYLRFVPADEQWRLAEDREIQKHLAACLRLIECTESTPRQVDTVLEETEVYNLWQRARKDVLEEWEIETDPANLQPRVRPLHHEVIEFLQKNRQDVEQAALERAVEILSVPWPQQEWTLLREWYQDESETGRVKAKTLVDKIVNIGINPPEPVKPLPLVEESQVELLCWMAINPTSLR